MVAGRQAGVGATEGLSLRVSVATLARVQFPHPDDGTTMLALEHKATLSQSRSEPQIRVQAQPFGGAVRLELPGELQAHIGRFHYDSERSRAERDLRLFIQPAAWPRLVHLCRQELMQPGNNILDPDPQRELVEEFRDCLQVDLEPTDYELARLGVAVEAEPTATDNVRAPGHPTARLYAVHQATITAPALCRRLLDRSRQATAEDMRRAVLAAHNAGGPGRANGVFVAPLAALRAAYDRLTPAQRTQPLAYAGAQLSTNVLALFEGLGEPRFEYHFG